MSALLQRHWPLLFFLPVVGFIAALVFPSVLFTHEGTDTYWLLTTVDYRHFPTAYLFVWIVLAVLAIGSLWEAVGLWKSHHILVWLLAAMSLLLTPLLLLGMIAAASPYRQLASTVLAAHTYHLAKYSNGSDGSLMLFQCDTSGWWCHEVEYTIVSTADDYFTQPEHTYQLQSSNGVVLIRLDSQPFGTFRP